MTESHFQAVCMVLSMPQPTLVVLLDSSLLVTWPMHCMLHSFFVLSAVSISNTFSGRKAIYGKELMIIIFATILSMAAPTGPLIRAGNPNGVLIWLCKPPFLVAHDLNY